MLAGHLRRVSQLKINVTNSYAGSIAWSNFFSRLTHRHPGPRRLAGVQRHHRAAADGARRLQALEQILGLYSDVAAAWVGALVADLASTSRWDSARRISSSSARISTTSIRWASAHAAGDLAASPRLCRRSSAPRRKRSRPSCARRRLRGGAGHRRGDRRPLLPRPRAARSLGGREADPLQHLRTCLRARGHGFCPAYGGRSARSAARSTRAATTSASPTAGRRPARAAARMVLPEPSWRARHAASPATSGCFVLASDRDRRHPAISWRGNHRRRSGGPCPLEAPSSASLLMVGVAPGSSCCRARAGGPPRRRWSGRRSC